MNTIRIELPPHPSSAGAARRFVITALHRLGMDAHSELAELLTSEVVTNAVLHARTSIALEVTPVAAGVRVDVLDGSPRAVRRRDYSEEATTGRGMSLVEALASSWGTDATAGGKKVWFELGGQAIAS